MTERSGLGEAGWEGQIVEVGSNRLLVLQDDAVWLVREGVVDVFAVRLLDGTPAGRRRHVLRAEAGSALFGIPPEPGGAGLGLVAVGVGGTRLQRLAPAALRAADRAGAVAKLVETWIAGLCGENATGPPPRDAALATPGNALSVPAKAAVTTGSGVAWVRGAGAAGRFLDDPELAPVSPGAWLPLTPRTWLTLSGPSEIEGLDTRAALDGGIVWPSLARLHQLVLERLALDEARAVQAEQERLVRKKESQERAVAHAVERLADVFRLTRAEEAEAEVTTDPFVTACRHVAEASGIPFRASAARAVGDRATDRLTAVARASRFRTRKVALAGEWWREDNGSLLGFRRESGGPVALVAESARRYLLVDPADGTRTRVDRAAATGLAGEAFSFYRPFPERALRAADLIRFGRRGIGRDIVFVAAVGILGGLIGLLMPIAVGMIFDNFIPHADREGLLYLAWGLVLAALAAGVFDVTRSIALLRVSGKLTGAVEAATWDRLLSLPVPFFRSHTAGDLALRATAVNVIQQTLTGVVLSTVVSGVFSLFNVGLMAYYSWRLAIVASGVVAAMLGAAVVANLLQLNRQRAVLALQGRIAGFVFELMNGIATLRTSGGEARAFAVWAGRFAAQKGLAVGARRFMYSVTVFNSAWSVVTGIALFWAMAFWLGQDVRAVDFLAFNAAFGQFLIAMIALVEAAAISLPVVPLYERARPILETPPEVDEAKADPGRLRGEIEVNKLSFRYSAEGPPVLDEVSFRIWPGQFVAFVGPSGAGKSTIYRLLLGFETPTSGTICYDGQDLAGLDLRAVRRQMGVVLQTGKLMTGSLFDNIIGAARLTMDDAWEAARAAGFEDDIKAMPMGMQTFLAEGASTLSGGQRQRLMVARAIVNKPRIVLFDEATSALDNQTQAIVSASLGRLNATRVVIAHRLSTIVKADRIYVIEAGRVVEEGTYNELMARDGRFAALARRQIA